AGQITRDEADSHPQRNVIYRAMGDQPDVEVDLFELLLSGDEALLLCSDGLSGKVPDEHLLRIWKTSVSPQEACDRMVAAANQAGGEDNITVIIVKGRPNG
ncbi:MAG: protein phosphatase 2C domain-containing protein, partial [Anaerolineae bacterium]